ncbi:uncharacterized protein LOC143282278 [Babylonia areolata]|uniref:uncharacterized protein LOC143282278 n=1 Tax=Babylonia areolata TaxID=304850 RepID=UPI003FD2CBC9
MSAMSGRSWASRTFSFRRNKTESSLGSKKLKGRKIRSSSDVRDLRDDAAGGDVNVPPSPGTPPSSPPVAAAAPTSRRKKIWNSFRSRTRRLRGKSRDKEGSFCESSADVGSGTTDEEQGATSPTLPSDHPTTTTTTTTSHRSSSFKRWR